jgi:uncharacterized protein
MKAKHLFFIAVLLTVGLIVFYAFTDTKSTENYSEKVFADRKARDREYKTSENSPIIDKITFQKLLYFEPNPNFRIKATLEVFKNASPYPLQMTNSEAERYERFGVASFEYQNKKYKLLLLKQTGDKTLFLAFGDKTNIKETYETGRYLNIPIPKTEEIVLDFNYAINPSCAYNEKFTCPLPPKENRLDFEIKAGEMKFMQKADGK